MLYNEECIMGRDCDGRKRNPVSVSYTASEAKQRFQAVCYAVCLVEFLDLVCLWCLMAVLVYVSFSFVCHAKLVSTLL